MDSSNHSTYVLRNAAVNFHGLFDLGESGPKSYRHLLVKDGSLGITLFLDEATWRQLVATVRAGDVPDEVDQK